MLFNAFLPLLSLILVKVPAGTPVTLNQPVQRVKSMFHQSGSKLNPPRLPSHPPPPQRSISHSEVTVYSCI